ncbi:MAG: GC-type dockerin domain-anchored protein [Planctomycetota bacterium]
MHRIMNSTTNRSAGPLVSAGIAAMLAAAAGQASAQTFSLDDNPDMPLTSAGFAGLYSAEDPFGLFLLPVPLGLIGPSPTLVTVSGNVFVDGDLLTINPTGAPEPVLDVVTPAGEYLDAVSADHEIFNVEDSEEMHIRFSVDRATTGLPGTDLEKQNSLNQQPGDIYISERRFVNPGIFVGTLGGPGFAGVLPTAAAGAPGSHVLELDESDLWLTAGLGPGSFVSDGALAPPIAPGEHDNVDAYNVLPAPTLDANGDLLTDIDYFFSIPPAEAFLAGVSAADIFAVSEGTPSGSPFAWAPAPFMGLNTMGFPPNPQIEQLDDIDGLVVWDIGRQNPDEQNRAEPGRDYALFSLSEASASLAAIRAMGRAVDGSTIFFTDFSGAFAVYLYGENIGVASLPFEQQHSNIDALEICAEVQQPCDPCVQADVNMDGVITDSDFFAWVTAFINGDLAGDVNCDGVVTDSDFFAWVTAFTNCP